MFKLTASAKPNAAPNCGIVFAINPQTQKKEFGIVVQGGRRLGVWFISPDLYTFYKLEWSSVEKFEQSVPYYKTRSINPTRLGLEWFTEFFKGKTPQTLKAPSFNEWVQTRIAVGDYVRMAYRMKSGGVAFPAANITAIQPGGYIVTDLHEDKSRPTSEVPSMVKFTEIDNIEKKGNVKPKRTTKEKLDSALPSKLTKSPVKLAAEQKVKAKWEDGKFYAGTILKLTPKGAQIKWADGTKPSVVPAADIKPAK